MEPTALFGRLVDSNNFKENGFLRLSPKLMQAFNKETSKHVAMKKAASQETELSTTPYYKADLYYKVLLCTTKFYTVPHSTTKF